MHVSAYFVQGSIVHVGRSDGGDKAHEFLPDATYKKMYDHSPHSVREQILQTYAI